MGSEIHAVNGYGELPQSLPGEFNVITYYK